MSIILTLDDVSATVRAADAFLAEHNAGAPWEWVDQTAAARYADVLRYCGRSVRLVDGGVEVHVPRTADGAVWGHAAADILDRAMAERHPDEDGRIMPIARGWRYTM